MLAYLFIVRCLHINLNSRARKHVEQRWGSRECIEEKNLHLLASSATNQILWLQSLNTSVTQASLPMYTGTLRHRFLCIKSPWTFEARWGLGGLWARCTLFLCVPPGSLPKCAMTWGKRAALLIWTWVTVRLSVPRQVGFIVLFLKR